MDFRYRPGWLPPGAQNWLMVTTWPWLFSDVPAASTGRFGEGGSGILRGLWALGGLWRKAGAAALVHVLRGHKGGDKFTRVEIVMILTAKSHPLEPLKLEKFGLHLCSVFKNQQVNLNCLALVYLRSDISQSTVAFSYREQFYFNHSWQFSRTYYLCLFFNRIVAEMLSAHWWLRTIILNVNFKDVVFFLLFFYSLCYFIITSLHLFI